MLLQVVYRVVSMPYVVDLLPGPRVIRVVFDGEVSLQDRSGALANLIEFQAESSFRNVLVDLTKASLIDASNSETLEYAVRLAREPVVRHVHIAYVGDPALGTSVECVAATRGYFYRRFRSQASALLWFSADRSRRAA